MQTDNLVNNIACNGQFHLKGILILLTQLIGGDIITVEHSVVILAVLFIKLQLPPLVFHNTQSPVLARKSHYWPGQ